MRRNVWEDFNQRFGIKCVEFYGASEGNCTMVNYVSKIGRYYAVENFKCRLEFFRKSIDFFVPGQILTSAKFTKSFDFQIQIFLLKIIFVNVFFMSLYVFKG